jgi:dihydrofolate reductase
MRQLILHMITSVDGFISTVEGEVNPHAQWDEEMQRHYLDLFTDSAGAVFGRNLYQQYVGHWSKVADGQVPAQTETELAWTQRLMAMDRYVVSNTLTGITDGTQILSGDVAAGISRIKQESGGDLLLMCGPALFADLTRRELIDQYMLYVCPNAMGRDNHLFRDISEPITLACDRTVPFSSGVNLQYYRPLGSRR